MIKENFNLSLYLLFPMIAKNGERWNSYFHRTLDSLINGYIGDINKPWLDNNIILVFDYAKIPSEHIDEFITNENFMSKYTFNMDKKRYIAFNFKIPNEFSRQLELIKELHYTSLDHATKIKLLSFWKLDHTSNLYNTLFVEPIEDYDINLEVIKEQDEPEDFNIITDESHQVY